MRPKRFASVSRPRTTGAATRETDPTMTTRPNPPEQVRSALSPGAFSGLLQALAALRNLRAFAAMLGCLIVGVLIAGIFSALASGLGAGMALPGVVTMLIAGATGLNAAGMLLLAQARGVTARSLPAALIDGFACIPKLVLLALTLLLAALAVFFVLALAYVICEIPVLGPILFVAVFPLSVAISGLTVWGLLLCLWLALPALWEGATITRALAQTLAIVQSRFVEATLLLAVAGLLAALVGTLVFGVLFSGLMPAVGLAALVFGDEGFGWLAGLARDGATGDEQGGGVGGPYGLAASIGGGLLWALAGSLSALVYLLGLNIVYLRVTEGLDFDAAETAIGARLAGAKRRAAGFGQQARTAAARASEQARQSAAAAHASATAAAAALRRPAEPPPAPPPRAFAPRARAAPPESTTPAVAKALTCPNCLSAVGNDDKFCAVCGHRLG